MEDLKERQKKGEVLDVGKTDALIGTCKQRCGSILF